jgi:type II secretory pathway pseudopilin PulG
LRTRLAQEGGMTLAELMITLSLLLVTTAAFLTVLQSVQTGVIRQQERSMTNDAARLAIQRLDREIRSGNVLYDPAGEALASYSMRIYTQANAPTRNPAFQCVQWKIEDQQLLRRSWPSGRPEEVSGWGTRTWTSPSQRSRWTPTPTRAGERWTSC